MGCENNLRLTGFWTRLRSPCENAVRWVKEQVWSEIFSKATESLETVPETRLCAASFLLAPGLGCAEHRPPQSRPGFVKLLLGIFRRENASLVLIRWRPGLRLCLAFSENAVLCRQKCTPCRNAPSLSDS